MGVTVGPSKSHSSFANYVDFATASLGASACGGRLYCKSGGVAWIVAPAATEVGMAWAGGQYNSTSVGTKCCVSEWSSLNTALTNGGLTPTQWFVPSITQLQSGYACRTYWDSFSPAYYWSSTERSATCACYVTFNFGDPSSFTKETTTCVRAFRCVTY